MKKLTTISFFILSSLFSTCSHANILSLNPLDHKVTMSVVAGAALYNYFIHNPDKLENFIANNPKKALALLGYIELRIQTTKSDKKREDFINFRDTLDLGYTEWRSQEIEKDPDWKKIRTEVNINFEKTKEELKKRKDFSLCNVKSLEIILQKRKDFNDFININLPRIYSSPTKSLNVNSFYVLDKEYDNKGIKMEKDHVPSFAAIEEFLKNKGLTTKTATKINPTGTKYKIRDKDLEANESAIAIPYLVHKNSSRTFGGRNTSKKIKEDSKDLELATEKDVATIAYFLYKNNNYGINYLDYIQASTILYSRNKLLCLYDVK